MHRRRRKQAERVAIKGNVSKNAETEKEERGENKKKKEQEEKERTKRAGKTEKRNEEM